MSDSYDGAESQPLPRLDPAPLGARFAAGALDFGIMSVLAVLFLAVPLFSGGMTLPMLAIFSVMLGYTVVPVWLFRTTLGMRVFGIELAGRNGRPAELFDLLFREMIGRGMFPVAYLGSLLFGFVGMLAGRAAMTFPVGLGFVLFLLSMFVLALCAVGHLLIFTRPDRRGLADLMAKTMAVPRTLHALPADAEEREEWETNRRRIRRNFIAFELVLALLGLGIPKGTVWFSAMRRNAALSTAVRLQLKQLNAKFKSDPANGMYTLQLMEMLEAQGRHDEAAAVDAEHNRARAAVAAMEEAAFRARIAANARDEGAVEALLAMLDERDDKEEARKVYRAYLETDSAADKRAGYGVWLYQHGFVEEAADVIGQAITDGVRSGAAHAYLGFALKEKGDKARARSELRLALDLDPDLDEARDVLTALEEEIGPEPTSPRKKFPSRPP